MRKIGENMKKDDCIRTAEDPLYVQSSVYRIEKYDQEISGTITITVTPRNPGRFHDEELILCRLEAIKRAANGELLIGDQG
jgi:hypothetical protein